MADGMNNVKCSWSDIPTPTWAASRQTVDGKFTYGAALGGSLTNINFRDASGSDGKLLSVRPMLFASYRYEDFHIDVAGGYAYHDLQITRNIRYGKTDSRRT